MADSHPKTRLLFLDGLRGWAALIVMLTHVFIGSLPPVNTGPLNMLAWWPFTGQFSVGIFFVVSGFALSVAFLQDNDRRRLLKMAGGRYVRLMVPIFATCALVSIFLNAGIIPAPDERLPAYATNYAFDHSVGHLLWFSTWAVFVNFDFVNAYAGPLWTMSYELIASYCLFALMLICPTATLRRIACLGIGLYLVAIDSVYCWFFFGMSAAELYLLMQDRPKVARRAGWLGWILLVVGYWLPLNSPDIWARVVLVGVTFWFFGTMLSPTMRGLMSSRFSLLLGMISFPLYLVHESMIVAVGGRLYVGATSTFEMFLAGLAAIVASVLLAIAFIPIDNLGRKLARETGNLLEYLVMTAWRRFQPSAAG